MTDNALHARVTAALALKYLGSDELHRHAAAAVLDALGLHREHRPGIVTASGRFITGPVETRYVTDWRPDA